MQLLLLQESWKDLFILHLSQWAIPWDLSDLLTNRQTQLRKEGNILPSEDEIIDMEMKSMQVSIFIYTWVCLCIHMHTYMVLIFYSNFSGNNEPISSNISRWYGMRMPEDNCFVQAR